MSGCISITKQNLDVIDCFRLAIHQRRGECSIHHLDIRDVRFLDSEALSIKGMDFDYKVWRGIYIPNAVTRTPELVLHYTSGSESERHTSPHHTCQYKFYRPRHQWIIQVVGEWGHDLAVCKIVD